MVRAPRRFNTLHIPKELQKALPFRSKLKQQRAKGRTPRDLRRVPVIREPHEKKVGGTRAQSAPLWASPSLHRPDRVVFPSLPAGGGAAPGADGGPPLQDQEGAQGAARQAQGVPAGEGEARGGQGQEAQGGTEKTVPRHGPNGPEEAEVQPEGGDAG